MATPLSPAPQAVLEKALDELDYVPERHVRWCIAAALRAAADQVVPANGSRKNNEIRAEFLAIADKLGAL